MKTFFLTVALSLTVAAQAATEMDRQRDALLVKIAETLKIDTRADWSKRVEVDGTTIPIGGMSNDKAVNLVRVWVPWRKKDGDPKAIADSVSAKVRSAIETEATLPTRLIVTVAKNLDLAWPDGNITGYYATPMYIATTCGRSYCITTASGGNVQARQGTNYAHRREWLAETIWTNYR